MAKDSDDYFVYNYSEKLINVLDYIYDFVNNDSTAYIYKAEGLEFMNNTSLFYEGRLTHMSKFRDVEFDYTVLPIPKFDDSQSSYYCRTYDTFFTIVPITCEDTDICGATFECLACEAYNKVLPAYIEDTLQAKYSQDSKTAEMIGLVIDTRTISLAEAYMFSIYGNDTFNKEFIKKPSLTAVSALEKVSVKTENYIDQLNEYFHSLNDN